MYSNQVKIFLCVAECGSFTQAAERLFISTTAVMKQINQLEYDLTLKLFNRTNQGVQLTPAGESLYTDAQFIVNYSQQSIARARQTIQDTVQVVRIGSSILNPCARLLTQWSKISHLYPHIKIQIVPFADDHTSILDIITNIGKQFDIIVGACSSPKWMERVALHQLGYYKVCCAVARTHKLAAKPYLTVSDLFGETLMMVPPTTSQPLDELREYLLKQHPQIIVENTTPFYDINVFNLCEQTNNILLTLDAWADVHFSLVTIPVHWEYKVPYGILYPRTPSNVVQQFIQALIDSENI